MPSFFEKLKRAFGFGPKTTYYTVSETTNEPVQVSYTPHPIVQESLESQEAAVDTKDDGIDLSAMTKAELVDLAKSRGLTVTQRLKKQDLIDLINSQPE